MIISNVSDSQSIANKVESNFKWKMAISLITSIYVGTAFAQHLSFLQVACNVMLWLIWLRSGWKISTIPEYTLWLICLSLFHPYSPFTHQISLDTQLILIGIGLSFFGILSTPLSWYHTIGYFTIMVAIALSFNKLNLSSNEFQTYLTRYLFLGITGFLCLTFWLSVVIHFQRLKYWLWVLVPWVISWIVLSQINPLALDIFFQLSWIAIAIALSLGYVLFSRNLAVARGIGIGVMIVVILDRISYHLVGI